MYRMVQSENRVSSRRNAAPLLKQRQQGPRKKLQPRSGRREQRHDSVFPGDGGKVQRVQQHTRDACAVALLPLLHSFRR